MDFMGNINRPLVDLMDYWWTIGIPSVDCFCCLWTSAGGSVQNVMTSLEFPGIKLTTKQLPDIKSKSSRESYGCQAIQLFLGLAKEIPIQSVYGGHECFLLLIPLWIYTL